MALLIWGVWKMMDPEKKKSDKLLHDEWIFTASAGGLVGGLLALTFTRTSLTTTAGMVAGGTGVALGVAAGLGWAYEFSSEETMWLVVCGALLVGLTAFLWHAGMGIAAAAPAVAAALPTMALV
jgi:hypothetical protein